jgi:hypothetical protein
MIGIAFPFGTLFFSAFRLSVDLTFGSAFLPKLGLFGFAGLDGGFGTFFGGSGFACSGFFSPK